MPVSVRANVHSELPRCDGPDNEPTPLLMLRAERERETGPTANLNERTNDGTLLDDVSTAAAAAP